METNMKIASYNYLKENKPGILLAKQLLNQIDDRDSQCAFWIISAMHKIKRESPKMGMPCLLNIIRDEMPKGFADYCEYIKHT